VAPCGVELAVTGHVRDQHEIVASAAPASSPTCDAARGERLVSNDGCRPPGGSDVQSLPATTLVGTRVGSQRSRAAFSSRASSTYSCWSQPSRRVCDQSMLNRPLARIEFRTTQSASFAVRIAGPSCFPMTSPGPTDANNHQLGLVVDDHLHRPT
jgi:hypothetical protein